MLKLLNKIRHYEKMINYLYWTAVDNEDFAEHDSENYDCPIGPEGHRDYANKIWDILGPIGRDSMPRLNSINKILYLKKLVKKLRQMRDYDLKLAQEHDDTSATQKDYVARWNEILGPFA